MLPLRYLYLWYRYFAKQICGNSQSSICLKQFTMRLIRYLIKYLYFWIHATCNDLLIVLMVTGKPMWIANIQFMSLRLCVGIKRRRNKHSIHSLSWKFVEILIKQTYFVSSNLLIRSQMMYFGALVAYAGWRAMPWSTVTVFLYYTYTNEPYSNWRL